MLVNNFYDVYVLVVGKLAHILLMRLFHMELKSSKMSIRFIALLPGSTNKGHHNHGHKKVYSKCLLCCDNQLYNVSELRGVAEPFAHTQINKLYGTNLIINIAILFDAIKWNDTRTAHRK